MENKTVQVGDKVVKRVNIIGTQMYVYSAWERSSYTGNHSSVTTIDGQCYGEVPSRRPTPELEALPAMSRERYERVSRYQDRNQSEAYGLIREGFVESSAGQLRSGEIVLCL